AIFTLARRGDLGAVKRALELDADPNIPDTLGTTARSSLDPDDHTPTPVSEPRAQHTSTYRQHWGEPPSPQGTKHYDYD
ncbi:unnamed protein product, partial [Cladocopium goreaui]